MDREKKYVPVLVRFDAEGKMRPVEIEFEEGQTFAVDRILDVRRAACRRRRRRPLHLPDLGQGDVPLV